MTHATVAAAVPCSSGHASAAALRTPREESFIQPIYDLVVPHYASGRLALAGDAATVARQAE